jgi:tetratricopeptide (TPR) repeat protein
MIHFNSKILTFKSFLHHRALFFILFSSLSFSQTSNDEPNKTLSDKFVYEGNTVVQDNFYEAEKKYRTALSKNKLNSKGAYNLSHAYYNAELYDEAQARLIEATKNGNKKEKHQAFHNLGNVFMKENACKKAVEAYKNALRNNPKDDETRYNLAIAKECAKEEDGGGGNDDEKKDKQQEKNKENEENKENKENKENEENKKGEDDKKDSKEKNNPENQQGKLSPQQIKNLLEAMNNEENKVQEKMNASKTKGIKVETDKDW